LTLCTLELNFDVPFFFTVLDEARNLVCATEDLVKIELRRNLEIAVSTYAWRPVEAETNGASYTTFTSAVWPEDHIQVGTRAELYPVVCEEIVQLNAHD
jgi:hypothetical protein